MQYNKTGGFIHRIINSSSEALDRKQIDRLILFASIHTTTRKRV